MSPRAAARLEVLGFQEVYDYAASKMDWVAMGFPSEGKVAERPRAGDVARKGAPTCRPDERLGAARERVEAAGWTLCLVLDESGVLVGRLGEDTLKEEAEALVEGVMEEGPSTTRPHTALDEIVESMQTSKVETIIVSRSDGRPIGVLYREDGEEALDG